MELVNETTARRLVERADLFLSDGDTQEARCLLEQAVRIDPSYIEARWLLDDVLNRPDEATRSSRNAKAKIEKLLCKARRNMWQPEAARPMLEYVLTCERGNLEAKYLLGRLNAQVALDNAKQAQTGEAASEREPVSIEEDLEYLPPYVEQPRPWGGALQLVRFGIGFAAAMVISIVYLGTPNALLGSVPLSTLVGAAVAIAPVLLRR
ncbi:MAG: hypothetical protein ACLQVD_09965 [Capsulimonadaceae bacterium]